MFRSALPCLAAAALLATAASGQAQVLGTFTWQTQPFCNRVSLTLTATPGGFVAAGTDDRCGAARNAGAIGFVTFNPDGTIGLTLAIGNPAGGRPVDLAATVNAATGAGAWSDSAGNAGILVLGGTAPQLSARPTLRVPTDVADNPGGPVDPCSTSGGEQELVLCGAGAVRWTNVAARGVQAWRDEDGRAHLRGSAHFSHVGFGVGVAVLRLPPALRPRRSFVVPAAASSAGGGPAQSVLLEILGDDALGAAGTVMVASFAANLTELHFGEIVFSVDR